MKGVRRKHTQTPAHTHAHALRDADTAQRTTAQTKKHYYAWPHTQLHGLFGAHGVITIMVVMRLSESEMSVSYKTVLRDTGAGSTAAAATAAAAAASWLLRRRSRKSWVPFADFRVSSTHTTTTTATATATTTCMHTHTRTHTLSQTPTS